MHEGVEADRLAVIIFRGVLWYTTVMNCDVVTIGTATKDVFLQSQYFKVLRDPEHLKKLGFREGVAECFAFGSKIDVENPVFTVGGGAANSAVTFARSGFKTTAVMSLGKDEDGRAVVEYLHREKVISVASFNKTKHTAYSTILLSPAGERTVLVGRGAADELPKHAISLTRVKPKWAYIAPGAISFNTIQGLIASAHLAGSKVAINPSGHYIKFGIQRLAPILAKADVVIMNRSEASVLTHTAFENERAIFKKLASAVSGIAVMTDGAKGVLVSDRTSIFRAGIFPEKKLVDRTGAGDAFGSGFVAGLIHKTAKTKGVMTPSAIEFAIRFGCANATSVVEQVGGTAGILSLKNFMSQSRWRRLPIHRTIL